MDKKMRLFLFLLIFCVGCQIVRKTEKLLDEGKALATDLRHSAAEINNTSKEVTKTAQFMRGKGETGEVLPWFEDFSNILKYLGWGLSIVVSRLVWVQLKINRKVLPESVRKKLRETRAEEVPFSQKLISLIATIQKSSFFKQK